MPRTYGDGQVHVSQIDVLFEHSELLPTHAVTASSEVGQAIGTSLGFARLCAMIMPDVLVG